MTKLGLKTYLPILHGPLEGLDYGVERPFITWQKKDLNAAIEAWLALDPPRLELATLAFDELNHREKSGKARASFGRAGLLPIGWLADARRACKGVLPAPDGGSLKGKVYVVLRWGYVPENGTYGAYVGSTKKTIAKRFEEHRTSETGAKGLKKYGIEPLYSLFDGCNPFAGKVCLTRETALHKALETVVPKVSGDVLKPKEEDSAAPRMTELDP